MSNGFKKILELAEEQSRPNFTQLQLAIAEMDARDSNRVNVADAYAHLRKTMERKFGLMSLDEIVRED